MKAEDVFNPVAFAISLQNTSKTQNMLQSLRCVLIQNERFVRVLQ